MTAGISYKLSYKQQAKVQILTLLSSKGQYLSLIRFKNIPCECQKTAATATTSTSTTTMIIPWPLVVQTEVKTKNRLDDHMQLGLPEPLKLRQIVR